MARCSSASAGAVEAREPVDGVRAEEYVEVRSRDRDAYGQ
jgi:hypothetical protein